MMCLLCAGSAEEEHYVDTYHHFDRLAPRREANIICYVKIYAIRPGNLAITSVSHNKNWLTVLAV